MKMRRVLLLLICFFGPTTISGATLEDAQKALQSYFEAYNTTDVTTSLFEEGMSFHEKLSAEMNAAKLEISEQNSQISQTIADFTSNAQKGNVSIDWCLRMVQTDLQNFFDDLNTRLNMCYGTVISSFNGLTATAYNRLWYEFDNEYYCNNMTIVECSQQIQQEQCYDRVISRIEAAIDRIPQVLGIIWADLLNQSRGQRIYCRKMVVQEIEIYSDLLMGALVDCVNSETVRAIGNTC